MTGVLPLTILRFKKSNAYHNAETNMTAADLIDAGFALLKDEQILHLASARGVLVGRVITARHEATGKTTAVRFWFNYSAPEVPLHHIDSVEV